MLSKFTAIPAIKMMQLILIFSVAFTTALTYAIICRLFDLRKDGRLLALGVVFTLFWVRGYYELLLMPFPRSHDLQLSIPNLISLGPDRISSVEPLVHIPDLEYGRHRADVYVYFLSAAAGYSGYSYRILKNGFKVLPPVVRYSTDFAYTVLLAVIHLKSGNTGKVGLDVLNHEGWCIPGRFADFGDFGDHKIGEYS